jgi:pimeloyl-ACP methyl ester carboxylesterase
MTESMETARTFRVQTEAVALNVTQWGDAGPRLLLLHGIGSRGVSWLPVVERLSREFRLIAPDLRGHGESGKPGIGYQIADYANDLENLLAALAVDRPLILGHSLGGLVAWEWASRNPRRAAAIVIEDSPLQPSDSDDALFEGWIALASLTPEKAAAKFREEHPDWTVEDCRRRAQSITSTHLNVFTESRSANRREQGRLAQIAKIESPMMLVYGDRSAGGMVSDEAAAAFVRTAPNGRVAKIDGGSHALHRDSSGAFLAAVLPFLSAHAR